MFASRKNKSTQQTNLNQSTSTAPTMAFKLNSSIGTDNKQLRSFHSPRILGVSHMSGGPTGSVNLQSPDFNNS
jgi:hypothetical protein